MEHEVWQILIVEDDERLAELTRDYLESHGLRVSVEGDGAQAAARIIAEQPDLVILDLMLPGEDGLSICRKVREGYDGVILMLTARTDDMDQVLGLDMGADDYVCKPVRPRLLLARIQALLRRSEPAEPAVVENQRRLQFGPLLVDNALREAWLQGEGIAVQGLRTPQGQLNYRLQRSDKQLVLEVQPGLVPPVGGVVLPWPYAGDPGEATINGETVEWVNKELHVHQLPARVEIEVPSAVRRAERKGQ